LGASHKQKANRREVILETLQILDIRGLGNAHRQLRLNAEQRLAPLRLLADQLELGEALHERSNGNLRFEPREVRA
jgi:hypothetical protein